MKTFLPLLMGLSFAFMSISQSNAADTFKVAWSHYTGWEPWAYADESGIVKKWADQYGIEITLSPPLDYIESINLYTVGEYQACVMTNMDMLTIPCVGGIDSTALIIGDYSNGNDGIVIKNGSTVNDLKGREIKLVELSVSHYVLARALDSVGLSEKDVTIVNTSDSDIASLFLTDSGPKSACVTWNPMLMNVRNAENATMVYDSSKIPGEILDLMVVRSDAPDTLKKALTGAWFEVMEIMSKPNSPKGKEAIQFMATKAGGTEAEFIAQLKTTAMFYTAKECSEFTKQKQIENTMEEVRTFCFDHGLFGLGAADKEFIGIRFADGTVIGDKDNVKMKFDSTFVEMAAEGKL